MSCSPITSLPPIAESSSMASIGFRVKTSIFNILHDRQMSLVLSHVSSFLCLPATPVSLPCTTLPSLHQGLCLCSFLSLELHSPRCLLLNLNTLFTHQGVSSPLIQSHPLIVSSHCILCPSCLTSQEQFHVALYGSLLCLTVLWNCQLHGMEARFVLFFNF